MKYLLLGYVDERAYNDGPESDREQRRRQVRHLLEELKANGQYVSSAPLQPTTSAKSVRVRDGKTLVTDGPFAETREQLGGYILIDVANLDEAIRISARLPSSATHTIEIRPVLEMAGLPAM